MTDRNEASKFGARLDDVTCLVTGATAGIGLVTARRLAEKGARVLMVGRDPQRGESALSQVAAATTGPRPEILYADLAEQAQVRRLAADVLDRLDRLDVLVNNAGAMFGRRQVSVDGIEMTLALNHLAYYLLTHLLLPALKTAAPARIVNVASRAHEGVALDFDDLQNARRYRGFPVYKRSKLANVLFTYELARRLESSGVTVNALHPGFVATDIGVRNGWTARVAWRALTLFAIDVESGADTSVYLASDDDAADLHGRYVVQCRPRQSSPASRDRQAQQRLWEESARLAGLDPD